MAGGGVKKPINVFKLGELGEPKGVFNWRLWFAVVSFGLMGAARGVDEGLISGAFGSKDFQKFIHYDQYSDVEKTNIKANVSAMVQLGSVAGALFAFVICDKIGRIWATRQLCVIWIIGIAIFMANNGHLGAVYAGRFIADDVLLTTVSCCSTHKRAVFPSSLFGPRMSPAKSCTEYTGQNHQGDNKIVAPKE
ncbi:MFS quinate transporter [Colletotrichum kahawae]|uniref:MFS quinate transporter n=1 Tax=Colletotrichum kahawae TaxID=34407 RepID=A0AAD9YPD4_COLKA|nr:MFS quinate transporter [Colletotrichum kahawae]